jgi:hypothetical protein
LRTHFSLYVSVSEFKVMIFEIDLQEQETLPAEPLPRVLPKTNDPNIAKRNRRMFGALIGTLEVGFQLLSFGMSENNFVYDIGSLGH